MKVQKPVLMGLDARHHKRALPAGVGERSPVKRFLFRVLHREALLYPNAAGQCRLQKR